MTKTIKDNYIKVGLSTCGIAAGADEVFKVLVDELKARGMDIPVSRCGCAGMCYAEPLVEVAIKGMPKVLYGKINGEMAMKIVRKHIVGKKLLNNHIYSIKG
ncbi:MAG: (2Fe-2S) ferredoxin domain-containing protein [Candidatus Omnitrophica bacterium]|nr:(2Fe-2S) ferredoxin domain-containing protein [Candidatus Omnitrophota bacterium]